MLSTEDYQRAIKFRVREAILSGHRAANIGRTLAGDGSFVSKLFDSKHKFQRETLQNVYANLHKLNDAPALLPKTQRYLTA